MLSNNSTQIKQRMVRFNKEAEERDAERRAVRQKKSYLNLVTTPIEIDALALIKEERAKELKMAAINLVNRNLIVAVFDFEREGVKEEILRLEKEGFKPEVSVVSASSLNHAWSFYGFVSKKRREVTGEVAILEERIKKFKEELKTIQAVQKKITEINFNEISVSDFFEIILGGALAVGASDLHIEPEKEGVNLRFRLDGVLNLILGGELKNQITREFHSKVVSRIKLLSGLRINVTDRTQDGRFTINLGNKDIEVRVAVAPSEFGEAVVMRVLDPESISLGLSELGLLEGDLKIVKEEMKKPNGMILATGPTGSGKTTTLYSFLREKNSREVKIITIEDPIEYRLEGIEQTQVDEEADYTFLNGLRSALRQDPDVILVGEIRDNDTAETAVNASLTGHLVFSTLHTNDSAGAVPRLIDLGVREKTIGSALNMVIAQRLVRKLCQFCKEEEILDEKTKDGLKNFIESLPEKIDKSRLKGEKIYKAKEGGCLKCSGIGYKGRVGIYELFKVDEKIQGMIEERNSILEIKKMAKEQGMATVQEDGVIKALLGMTSFEEIERVTGVLNFYNK